MFIDFENPLRTSIVLYLTIATVLYIVKPAQLFDKNGFMIEFGLGEGKTCFSYPIAIFTTAIILHFVLASCAQKTT